jgi:flagellar basal body rod protein FlgG
MKYGLYVAAAGALTSMHRQDVQSNNLANMNTVGFKPDSVALRQFPSERELNGADTPPRAMLERLGGVVQADDTRPVLSQGTLVAGRSPYDLAIEGDGFFALEGGSGPDDPMLTRDGRFTMSADGRLVTAAGGRAVLGDDDLPIFLDPSTPVTIDEAGLIRQGDRVVGALKFVDVAPGADLRKVGDGMLRLREPGGLSLDAPGGRIHQNKVENSAVDPIATMNRLMAAAKSAQSNIRMMQFHDYLSGQAINTLGRV